MFAWCCSSVVGRRSTSVLDGWQGVDHFRARALLIGRPRRRGALQGRARGKFCSEFGELFGGVAQAIQLLRPAGIERAGVFAAVLSAVHARRAPFARNQSAAERPLPQRSPYGRRTTGAGATKGVGVSIVEHKADFTLTNGAPGELPQSSTPGPRQAVAGARASADHRRLRLLLRQCGNPRRGVSGARGPNGLFAGHSPNA